MKNYAFRLRNAWLGKNTTEKQDALTDSTVIVDPPTVRTVELGQNVVRCSTILVVYTTGRVVVALA